VKSSEAVETLFINTTGGTRSLQIVRIVSTFVAGRLPIIAGSFRQDGIQMSISSISTPPATPVQPIEPRSANVRKQDADERNPPPPPRPPLPPGQGTRIDQYV